MYHNRNINNFAPGRKLIFLGFRGRQPASAAFCLEKFENGVMRIVDILHVPIHRRPNTRRGYRRTKSWALRRAREVLEKANGEQAELPNSERSKR